MYEVHVERSFVAQHYLTVPNCGPENEWHSHTFKVCLDIASPSLNTHQYVVDIDDVNRALDAIEARYRDVTLNDLPEFEGKNPSVEWFARCVHAQALDVIEAPPEDATLTVRIWEDDTAWAAYTAPMHDD
ncbi:6-pyruvoyl trahydropterin synthase family protein [Salisaeta longa]|uniref:6-pyruvoyl trahydropterin synthase family protein n=1 Tax=Salisaeta longa TaxID=503170 RepID=UPI0003B64A54|nr:6-carboxytetrahydropterin synthase [Salisaeta longa]